MVNYICAECGNHFHSRYICDPVICDDCIYEKKEDENDENKKRNKIINECIWTLKENKRHPVIDICIQQLENMIK